MIGNPWYTPNYEEYEFLPTMLDEGYFIPPQIKHNISNAVGPYLKNVAPFLYGALAITKPILTIAHATNVLTHAHNVLVQKKIDKIVKKVQASSKPDFKPKRQSLPSKPFFKEYGQRRQSTPSFPVFEKLDTKFKPQPPPTDRINTDLKYFDKHDAPPGFRPQREEVEVFDNIFDEPSILQSEETLLPSSVEISEKKEPFRAKNLNLTLDFDNIPPIRWIKPGSIANKGVAESAKNIIERIKSEGYESTMSDPSIKKQPAVELFTSSGLEKAFKNPNAYIPSSMKEFFSTRLNAALEQSKRLKGPKKDWHTLSRELPVDWQALADKEYAAYKPKK